jgi:hypothetical protein
MNGRDLFGRETPLPALRPEPTGEAFDLIDYAARVAALASGRALAQERAELVAPEPNAAGLPLFEGTVAPCEP